MAVFDSVHELDVEVEYIASSSRTVESVKLGWYLATCSSIEEAVKAFMPDIEDWERIGQDSQPTTLEAAIAFLDSYGDDD